MGRAKQLNVISWVTVIQESGICRTIFITSPIDIPHPPPRQFRDNILLCKCNLIGKYSTEMDPTEKCVFHS